MTRRTQITMNPGQRNALAGAGTDGRLTAGDRRVLSGLVRRGWVRVVETRKRRKLIRSYVITDAGREALAAGEVVTPRPRPLWLPHWDRERRSGNCYVVEGHKLFRPGRDMLWRVLCPAHPVGHVVGYHETVAEAVAALTTHLARSTCPRGADTVPCAAEELATLDVPADDTHGGRRAQTNWSTWTRSPPRTAGPQRRAAAARPVRRHLSGP